MTKRKKFNVNDTVMVRVTKRGWEIHRLEHEKFCAAHWKIAYSAPAENSEGWSSWQLWRLMETFGPYISIGFDLPFEPTMKFR